MIGPVSGMGQNSSHNQSDGFQCHLCDESIPPSLTNCPYCGAVIGSAESQPPSLSPNNKAGKEATILKVMARALAVSFLAVAMSVIEGLAFLAFITLLILVPVMLIRWWIKYRSLPATNPDYARARQEVSWAAVIWVGVIIVWLSASLILSWRQMGR